MPSSNVQWPVPLQRQDSRYNGLFGVPGTWSDTGERFHCTGKILYVDPNFPGTSDSRDGTDPTSPLTTIQAAVNMTTDYAGDVIVVMQNASWQYAGGTVYTTGIVESVTLDRAGVRLVGVSPGGVGVPWAPGAAGETCLTVSAIDCVVEGFAFIGDGAAADGIYCEWDGVTLFGENLVVRHCLFDEDIDTAIALEFSWFCYIHDCIFQQCDVVGIGVDVGGSGAAFTQVRNNTFFNCTAAMSFLGGCDDNLIADNFIFNANAQAAAAAVNEGINTTGGARNLVTGNSFSCLLPVPANGDWDDLNTAAATDAWMNNHCMNGDNATNPT